MDASRAMRRLAPDRLRLHAPPDEVLAWLRAHANVAQVASNDDGVVDVVVREPRAIERLARSLADRLFAASKPAQAPFEVRVVHAVPGRVRLAVSGVGDERIASLAQWLRDRAGVTRVSPSPASRSIVVVFDPEKTSPAVLAREALRSEPRHWPRVDRQEPDWRRAIATTGVLAASVAAGSLVPAPILGAAVATTALPSVARAALALREGRIGVDALDVVAVGLSIGTGRFATGAFITSLLAVGDLLLGAARARARGAITERLDLEAADAHRIRGSSIERVEARALRPGDLIVVDTGARVAADGVVESGDALVDERALTGESMPRARRRRDRVLSASVVVDGQIVVRVERVGADTAARKIADVLAGAGTKPMTLQANAEKVADRLVLPTFALAAGVGAAYADLARVTSVLITDFGTGLRIAVPTAALATMTSAARAGVLVKGGQFLERLARVDTVVFDKTGTLTRGEPDVLAIDVVGERDRAACLALAAAAEARQKHPVARAVRRAAAREGVVVPQTDSGTELVEVGRAVSARVGGVSVVVGGHRAMHDRGIDTTACEDAVARHRASAASSVFVAADGRVAAVLAVADQPRAESRDVVDRLRAEGRRRVLLLSGDARPVAEAIGAALGVDEAHGELLPDDKVRIVRELQAAGRTVAMIGDGLNDAPALAVADVGISIDGGTDIALEAADVVLLEGGLTKLPDAFAIADRGMKTVKRSLAMVLAPNAVAIVLGAFGLLPPGLAALVNNGSTVAAALVGLAPLVRIRRRAGASR